MSQRAIRRAQQRRVAGARRRETLRRRRAGLAVGAALGAAAFLAPQAQADTTFTVNTVNDTAPGACDVADCTLREAINDANATTGNDTINFTGAGATGTIRLTSALGPLVVDPVTSTDALTVNGPGRDALAVSGDSDGSGTPNAGDVRILTVADGQDLTIRDLTLTRGFLPAAATAGGAAILGANGGGTLSLVDARVTDSRSESTDGDARGGAIQQQNQDLTLRRTTLTGNTATATEGGAVATYISSGLTIDHSTFSDNTAESGGAVATLGGLMTADASSFTGNHATTDGGGAIRAAGSLEITRSTISGNTSASGPGGGLYALPKYTFDVVDSTIAGNSAPQGAGIAFAAKYGGSESNVLRTTISGNHATTGGGGISVLRTRPPDSLTVNRSTISGNTGGGGSSSGGGIAFPGSTGYTTINGDFTLLDSTVSGNSAANGGGVSVGTLAGGEVLGRRGSIAFDNSTVARNTATSKGGGFYLAAYDSDPPGAKKSATVAGNSTIFADNTAGGAAQDLDRGNTSTSGGFSLAFSLVEKPGDAPISQTPAGSSLIGIDPLLGPLASNGGTTRTQLPAATSPAIDRGLSSPRLLVDQRGRTRDVDAAGLPNPPRGDGTDIGAVEVQNPFVPAAPTKDKRPRAVIRKNRLDAKKKRKRVVRGTASDDHAVAKVQVALVRKVGGRCRELQKSGSFGRKRRCTIPPHRFLKANGKRRWKFKLSERLDTGRYVVYARAIDDKGQKQRSFTRKNRRTFRVG